MVETLHGDLRTIFSLLILTKPQTTFIMFSLCCAQFFSYLFRIMFPSPCLLKHYIKFDIHTIITLEKLFIAGSFGGSIGHLDRC
jgi:hypothetical protein